MDEQILLLEKKIKNLTAELEDLSYQFYKKTGSGSNDLRPAAIQSKNYIPGTQGWKLDEQGNAEIGTGTIRTDILIGSATAFDTGAGIFIGDDGGTYKFRAGDPGDISNGNLEWSGTQVTVYGRLVINRANVAPYVAILFSPANLPSKISSDRRTTASNGTDLTIEAGGGKASESNLSGGNLVLSGGVSTGTGTSDVIVKTHPAGASGTADNTPTTKVQITGNGNVVLGAQAALATNAADGFTYMPTCAGAPTGTPTAYTGKVAMVYDTTNNLLYIYNGAWKSVTLA